MDLLHSIWNAAQPLVTPLAIAVGAWLHARVVKTPSDADRAATLARLAQDAAAAAVALFPKSSTVDLVRHIVNTMASTGGVPTRNAQALERAAYGALAKLNPDA